MNAPIPAPARAGRASGERKVNVDFQPASGLERGRGEGEVIVLDRDELPPDPVHRKLIALGDVLSSGVRRLRRSR
jgi:hypothetical protein